MVVSDPSFQDIQRKHVLRHGVPAHAVDDVIQDAYLAFYRGLYHKRDEEGRAKIFWRILTNTAKRWHRSAKRYARVIEEYGRRTSTTERAPPECEPNTSAIVGVVLLFMELLLPSKYLKPLAKLLDPLATSNPKRSSPAERMAKSRSLGKVKERLTYNDIGVLSALINAALCPHGMRADAPRILIAQCWAQVVDEHGEEFRDLPGVRTFPPSADIDIPREVMVFFFVRTWMSLYLGFKYAHAGHDTLYCPCAWVIAASDCYWPLYLSQPDSPSANRLDVILPNMYDGMCRIALSNPTFGAQFLLGGIIAMATDPELQERAFRLLRDPAVHARLGLPFLRDSGESIIESII